LANVLFTATSGIARRELSADPELRNSRFPGEARSISWEY